MTRPDPAPRRQGLRQVRRATTWLVAGSIAGTAAFAGVAAATVPGHNRIVSKTSGQATTGTPMTTDSQQQDSSDDQTGSEQFQQPSSSPTNNSGGGAVVSGGS